MKAGLPWSQSPSQAGWAPRAMRRQRTLSGRGTWEPWFCSKASAYVSAPALHTIRTWSGIRITLAPATPYDTLRLHRIDPQDLDNPLHTGDLPRDDVDLDRWMDGADNIVSEWIEEEAIHAIHAVGGADVLPATASSSSCIAPGRPSRSRSRSGGRSRSRSRASQATSPTRWDFTNHECCRNVRRCFPNLLPNLIVLFSRLAGWTPVLDHQTGRQPGPPLVCVRPFVTMRVGVARTEGSGLHRLIVQILPAHQCLRSLGSHCLTPASGKHACLPAASSSLPLPAIAPVCLSTSSQTVVHQPLVHLWPPMFSLPGYRTDRACQPASSTSIQRRSGPKSRGSRVCLLLHLLLLCHQLQPVTAAGSEARVVNPTAGFTEGVSALRPISDSAPKPSGIPPSSPTPSQAVSRYVKRSYRRACQRALRQGSTTYRGRLLEARQVPHHLRSSSSCSQYPTTPCAACCQTGAPGLLLERRRTWRRTLCRADDVSNQFPIRCCHHS